MANEPTNSHDAFFKHYLSQPNVAVDFLRQHLPAEILAVLDLSQMTLEKDSFVDERLRSYFSDLIYNTMTLDQTPLRIALLWEHKSYPYQWSGFQTLHYAMGYWLREFDRFQAERKRENEKRETSEAGSESTKQQRSTAKLKLTPILPLLVYHGEEKWNVELSFARHFAGMEDPTSTLSQVLKPYIPDFVPYFVNLSTIADEAIQGEVLTRLFVLVLKYIFVHGLGGHLDEILRMAAEVMQQPNGMTMVMALLRYIGRSAVKVNKAEIAQKLLAVLPKEGGVLMETMAQEWIEEGKSIGFDLGKKEGIDLGKKEGIDLGKKEGIDLGKKEGIDIGKKEGKKEGIDIGIEEANRRTVQAMLANQFSVAEIARIIGFSVQEVERLLHKPERPLAALLATEVQPPAQGEMKDEPIDGVSDQGSNLPLDRSTLSPSEPSPGTE